MHLTSMQSINTAQQKLLCSKCMQSDIMSALDRGSVAALILLDLPAAFDAVDLHVLLDI